MVLLTLCGCQCEQQGRRAELRLDDGRPLQAAASFAVLDAADHRTSTLPPPIPAADHAVITTGFLSAAAEHGFIHAPDDPQLLVLLYREVAAPRREEAHPVRVDWRHGEHSGTYRYLLARQAYPDYRTGILVCDVVDAASGILLRQFVDPDYFLLRKLAAKEETGRVPAGYRFQMGVLVAQVAGRYAADDEGSTGSSLENVSE